jgi:hypothetical protein
MIIMSVAQDHIWLLFARKLAMEASADELEELNNLLITHPATAEAIKRIELFWDSQTLSRLGDNTALATHIRKIITEDYSC